MLHSELIVPVHLQVDHLTCVTPRQVLDIPGSRQPSQGGRNYMNAFSWQAMPSADPCLVPALPHVNR